MDKKKEVSVIIPTYNNAEHIKNAIESVLNQTFKDLEIIIIDDGSTDNTKNILKQYIESNLIIYLHQDNKGTCLARNKGVSIALGFYIAFLDSDDEWIDRNKLKKQVEFLSNNPDYVLVGTGGIIVDEKKNLIMNYNVPETDISIRKNILLKNPFIQSSVVIRKDILIKAGLYLNEKYVNAEDYNLWLRVGLLGKFFNLIKPMTMYMAREGNTSSNYKKDILKNNIYLINKYNKKYSNYIKALLFGYFKFFIYSALSLVKDEKLKDRIIKFLFKEYRKLNFTD